MVQLLFYQLKIQSMRHETELDVGLAAMSVAIFVTQISNVTFNSPQQVGVPLKVASSVSLVQIFHAHAPRVPKVFLPVRI